MNTVDLLSGLGAAALLVFPGWLLARAHRLPLPLLAGLISGAVALVLIIQLLDAGGLALSARTILPAWLLVLLGAVWCGRKPALTAPAADPRIPARPDWWLMLPVLPAIAMVTYRAVTLPLFGVDNIFRWNFLAEQMVAHRTLAFYPPVTAGDYAIYSWPDGIAPAVSSLYFWIYSLAGATRPELTAPLIVFQFLLLLAGAYALARQMASPKAGAIACGLVACSPIVLWSTGMGQESALMAVALLGLLLYLPASRETVSTPATLAAGLAAALAGLAREYGPAIICFGFALGLARRLPARTLGLFLLTALAGALPWYGRNWLHTGNPFFNLDVAGLFPVNRAHLRLMQVYQESFGWAQAPADAPRIFLANTSAALFGVIAGALYCFRPARSLLAAIALVTALWFVSVSYTAGGFTYALRVLTPALVIAAALGGVAIARWVSTRSAAIILSCMLLALATDAALRSLLLPLNVYDIPPAAWVGTSRAMHLGHLRTVYRELADLTAGRRILTVAITALLNNNGARTVPVWSPEVAYLWDPAFSPAEVTRRLADSGIGFVLIPKGDINRKYLIQIPYFRHKLDEHLQPVWSDAEAILFQVKPTAR